MKNIRVIINKINIFQIPFCVVIKFLAIQRGGWRAGESKSEREREGEGEGGRESGKETEREREKH